MGGEITQWGGGLTKGLVKLIPWSAPIPLHAFPKAAKEEPKTRRPLILPRKSPSIFAKPKILFSWLRSQTRRTLLNLKENVHLVALPPPPKNKIIWIHSIPCEKLSYVLLLQALTLLTALSLQNTNKITEWRWRNDVNPLNPIWDVFSLFYCRNRQKTRDHSQLLGLSQSSKSDIYQCKLKLKDELLSRK